jgi:hypothetical protein
MSGEFIIILSYVLGQFGIYFNILDANTLTSIYKHTQENWFDVFVATDIAAAHK